MKSYFILILLLVLGACGSAVKVDDNTTQEKLAETILSAVIHNDTTLLAKHTFTNRDDLKVFYEKFWETDELQHWHIKNLNRINEARPTINKSFERVRERFSQKGLEDWDGMTLKNVEFSETERGSKLAKDVKIQFTNGEFIGVIVSKGFAQMERGWVLLHPLQFQFYGANTFGR